MALPTQSDVATLDYPFNGQPFCSVGAKSSIDMNTMDYPFNGQPFVGQPFGSTPPPTGGTLVFVNFIGV